MKKIGNKKILSLSLAVLMTGFSTVSFAEMEKLMNQGETSISQDVDEKIVDTGTLEVKDEDENKVKTSDDEENKPVAKPVEDTEKGGEKNTEPPKSVVETQEKFTVKFNTNGGERVSDMQVYEGDTISTYSPEKDEYTFLGWYLDKAFESFFTSGMKITEDTTLFAKWEKEYIKLKFDTNKGNKISDREVRNGKTLSDLPTPKKRGYTFMGWYKDKGFKDRFKLRDSIDTADKEMTLYAKWKEDHGNLEVNMKLYDSKGNLKINNDEFLANDKDYILDIIKAAIKDEKKAPEFDLNSYGEIHSFDGVKNTESQIWNVYINNHKIKYKDLKDHELKNNDKIEIRYDWFFADPFKSYINKEMVGTYIKGYEDGTFKPENHITRGEVATVFYRIIDDIHMERSPFMDVVFKDVNNRHWAEKYISNLSKLKVLNGYENGDFKPMNYITRGEIAVLISRIDRLPKTASNHFNDIADFWGRDEVNSVVDEGFIKGYEDGSFRPNDYITRAELVTIVNRVLNRSQIRLSVRPFLDLDSSKWYHDEILKAF